MDKQTKAAIENIESRFFRTVSDTGAHPNAKLIWDAFRQEMGLNPVVLPEWCSECREYHTGHCKSKSIKTYIIQYRHIDGWRNYQTGDSFAVEFLFLEAAKHTASELCHLADASALSKYPEDISDWRIKSSTGEEFALK